MMRIALYNIMFTQRTFVLDPAYTGYSALAESLIQERYAPLPVNIKDNI